MQTWSNRVVEEANLFNPAFCTSLIAKAADEYNKKAHRALPFALGFLVLPIVLHHGTRAALPSTTVTSLLPWVQDNREQLVDFSIRVQRLREIGKEAILFGLQHETLVLSHRGDLLIGPKRQSATEKRTGLFTDEARECVDRAGFIGRWFAGAGSTAAIFCRMGDLAVSLQIAKLILYSRTGEIRELSFRTGAMNILTGASKTGKSAIIDIVDYVTGRSECNVADGVIRKYVGWYALLFQLDEGQIFVARRNPEVGARTSGDVCLARASQIETPPISELVKNITVNALESFLGAAIGISENEHRPPTPTRDPLEANFRHALLFSFQDQNDIDSKQRLFHRQGEDYVGPPRPRLSDFRPAFPAHYPPERDANGSIDGLSDEDQTAVLQLFKVLSDAAKELTPGLQIIVLDHADLKRDWFDEAVVERWRRGKMLVPPDWIK